MYFFWIKFLNKKNITVVMPTQKENDNMDFEKKINDLCKSLDCSGKELNDNLWAFEKKISSTNNLFE